MKLQQLAIGARFEYEGQVYVKTGPVTAASEQGGQRMIPRYAVLRPLDLPTATEKPPRGRVLSEAKVLRAFEDFWQTLAADAWPEAQKNALTEARARFLAALR